MAPNSNITGDDLVITSITAKDMRWPTSLGGHGSDAMVILFIKTTKHTVIMSKWRLKITTTLHIASEVF